MTNEVDDGLRECEACSEEFDEEPFRTDEGEEICRICWEEDLMQPAATVKTREYPDGLRIGSYRNRTKEVLGENHFTTEWHSTSAWRGYYSVGAKGKWNKVDADQVLTSWNDKELKDKYEELKERAERAGLEWALVSSRTSNVFSNSAEFYVLGDPEKLEEVAGA